MIIIDDSDSSEIDIDYKSPKDEWNVQLQFRWIHYIIVDFRLMYIHLVGHESSFTRTPKAATSN